MRSLYGSLQHGRPRCRAIMPHVKRFSGDLVSFLALALASALAFRALASQARLEMAERGQLRSEHRTQAPNKTLCHAQRRAIHRDLRSALNGEVKAITEYSVKVPYFSLGWTGGIADWQKPRTKWAIISPKTFSMVIE